MIGHDNWVKSLATHHKGTYIYSVSDDKTIRIWDLKTMKGVKKINDAHTNFISGIDIHPSQLLVVTGSVDN